MARSRATVELDGKGFAPRVVDSLGHASFHMIGADQVSVELSAAGFIAAKEEAALLVERANGDSRVLRGLVARRLTGEPLAWIVGKTSFCGLDIRVDSGVYVPRPQTEQLARRAVARLAPTGIAVDLCTGSGAVAAVLSRKRPAALVYATDIDPDAVACARTNGVNAYVGDLFTPLSTSLKERVDVVVAVPPYVPSHELRFLQRDTFKFESELAYHGGPDGTVVLRRIIADSVDFLCPGGTLLLELGGNQDTVLTDQLNRLGYSGIRLLRDEDGDLRGLEAAFTHTKGAAVSKTYTGT
jgi:release factor glutamine methyltransferase